MSDGSSSLIGFRDRLAEWAQDDLHVGQSVRMHEPVYANPAQIRADVREALHTVDRSRSLLEEAWQIIASARQPDDAKAISENGVLERIEELLRV